MASAREINATALLHPHTHTHTVADANGKNAGFEIHTLYGGHIPSSRCIPVFLDPQGTHTHTHIVTLWFNTQTHTGNTRTQGTHTHTLSH